MEFESPLLPVQPDNELTAFCDIAEAYERDIAAMQMRVQEAYISHLFTILGGGKMDWSNDEIDIDDVLRFIKATPAQRIEAATVVLADERLYRLKNGIHYVQGDATQPIGEGPKIIAHICNDQGAWGAGFTKALDERHPLAGRMYREWYKTKGHLASSAFQLGKNQFVNIERDALGANVLSIANMVAQHGLRSATNPTPIDYGALDECFRYIALSARLNNASIHMPRIGTGLAGGDWDIIAAIITKHIEEEVSVTVYDL